MIKNYFKIAFRNIVRHKAFSFINIIGLSIGMACSILILLWVQDERSYDRFHTNADQTYRVLASAGDFRAAVNPAGMPAGLKKEMPQIKNTVRLSKPSNELFEVGEKKFEEKRVFFVDSTFFEVFSFQLIKGNIKTALERPNNILISEDMAKKYFGPEDPMGKIIRRNNEADCVVTGVLANVPSNSHLQFDFILPLSSWYNWNWDLKNNTWGNFNFYAYLQVDKSFEPTKANLAMFNKQMDKIYDTHQSGGKIKFQLQ